MNNLQRISDGKELAVGTKETSQEYIKEHKRNRSKFSDKKRKIESKLYLENQKML